MAFNVGKFAGNAIQGYDQTVAAQQAITQQKLKDAIQKWSGQLLSSQGVQPMQGNAPQPGGVMSGNPSPTQQIPGQIASPQVPTPTPLRGVSPQSSGAVPAAGAPGGAGPVSPMGGASAPQAGGMSPLGQSMNDLAISQLVQRMQAIGVPKDMYGYVAQDYLNMMRPQASNAARIDLALPKENIAQERVDKMRDWRDPSQRWKPIAPKETNGMTTPELVRQEGQLRSMIDSDNFTPEEKENYKEDLRALRTELNNRRTKAGLPAKPTQTTTKPTVPAMVGPALAPVPVPPEAANQPDGATATDENGVVWTKQGNMMIPPK